MPPAKLALAAVTACVLLALAVPTAAVSVSEDTQVDDVILEPANTNYATVEDGEIRLDLEALNDRAVTTVDEVLTITVTDDAVEEVWFEGGTSGLSFYDGDPTATVGESSPLELEAGETASVGVAVDTHVAQTGTETFTIHVVYDDETDDDSDEGGDDGDGGGDGSSGGGSSGGGESPTADEDEPAAAIEQIDLEDATTTVESGETVTVNATYENSGNITGERTVELTEDGVGIESETITLASDETATVSFEWHADETGTYDLAVDGTPAGTITVEDPGPTAMGNRELSASTTAALGPPAALGILTLLTVARRRWDQTRWFR